MFIFLVGLQLGLHSSTKLIFTYQQSENYIYQPCHPKLKPLPDKKNLNLGGGGILVLFVVRGRAIFRGTFSNHYGIMGIIFTIF